MNEDNANNGETMVPFKVMAEDWFGLPIVMVFKFVDTPKLIDEPSTVSPPPIEELPFGLKYIGSYIPLLLSLKSLVNRVNMGNDPEEIPVL